MTDPSFLLHELDKARISLSKQKRLGKLLGIISLGIFRNRQRIVKASEDVNYNETLIVSYEELIAFESEIDSTSDWSFLNNVRLGENISSTIPVILKGDYGINWDVIRNEILGRDQNECQEADGYCTGPLQVHHITPLSLGGTNQTANLITLCLYHHSLKHEHMKRKL